GRGARCTDDFGQVALVVLGEAIFGAPVQAVQRQEVEGVFVAAADEPAVGVVVRVVEAGCGTVDRQEAAALREARFGPAAVNVGHDRRRDQIAKPGAGINRIALFHVGGDGRGDSADDGELVRVVAALYVHEVVIGEGAEHEALVELKVATAAGGTEPAAAAAGRGDGRYGSDHGACRAQQIAGQAVVLIPHAVADTAVDVAAGPVRHHGRRRHRRLHRHAQISSHGGSA